MTSSLSNRALRALLALVFTLGPLAAGAEEYQPGSMYEPSMERSSLPEEAARAVFGRVFGVQGEGGDVRYYAFDMSSRSPLNAAARSALVPGWGQYFNSQKVKGTLLFATFTGALIASLNLYSKSSDNLDDYRARGVKDDSIYDDYSRQHDQANFLMGVAVVVYAIGILDAYKNAYSPLYGTDRSVDVAWTSDGGEIRLQQRF